MPEKYEKLLKLRDIKIIKAQFDNFTFNDKYLWNLAFYKLCALEYVVKNYNYKYYSYMDSDVYIQSSFDNIWKECDTSILLYDINHGLQVKDYRIIVDEFSVFLGTERLITHYGGEFFAANRENAEEFIAKCESIYQEMLKKDFTTTKGDEFILSLAGFYMKEKVKNAGAYIFRFWTGSFRLVSTCYINNQVTVLHVPAEKERGMIKVYNKFISKNKLPKNKVVYKKFRINHVPLMVKLRQIVKAVFNK